MKDLQVEICIASCDKTETQMTWLPLSPKYTN